MTKWRLSSSTILLKKIININNNYNYKILLQQRGQISNSGMFTFPGGVYEQSDINLKITAMRELFEEVGGFISSNSSNTSNTSSKNNIKNDLINWRKIIRSDPTKFHDFMSTFNLSDQSCNFHHHCTFITPNFENRKYTTLFFISEISEYDSNQLEADGTETSSLLWIDPLSALELNKKGEMVFLPPQYYILSELSSHQTIESVFANLNKSNTNNYHPEAVYDLIDSRGYPPLKPDLMLSNESKVILTFPYDELHPDYPGKQGNLNRIHCTLPMGKGGYHFERNV